VLEPNGRGDDNGLTCVGLELLRGGPRKVRYQIGSINLGAVPPLELPVEERVFAEDVPYCRSISDLPAAGFRDPAAGWVARGCAAPFVRILEVRDATPEEVEAAEAANV